MYLDELTDLKEQLLSDLLTNEDIVKLVNPDIDLKDAKDLMYSQVFPYEHVPDTVEDGKTFICCEIDVTRPNRNKNSLYVTPIIYIWVFTHKSLLRLPNGEGVRVDKLCSEIDKKVNGSLYYTLGHLQFYSLDRFSPAENFQGKCIIYDGDEINHYHQYNQSMPKNRRTGV